MLSSFGLTKEKRDEASSEEGSIHDILKVRAKAFAGFEYEIIEEDRSANGNCHGFTITGGTSTWIPFEDFAELCREGLKEHTVVFYHGQNLAHSGLFDGMYLTHYLVGIGKIVSKIGNSTCGHTKRFDLPDQEIERQKYEGIYLDWEKFKSEANKIYYFFLGIKGPLEDMEADETEIYAALLKRLPILVDIAKIFDEADDHSQDMSNSSDPEEKLLDKHERLVELMARVKSALESDEVGKGLLPAEESE